MRTESRDFQKKQLLDMLNQQNTHRNGDTEYFQQELKRKVKELEEKGCIDNMIEVQVDKLCEYTLQLEEQLKIRNSQIDELHNEKTSLIHQIQQQGLKYEDLQLHYEDAITQLQKYDAQLLDYQEQIRQASKVETTETWEKEKKILLKKLTDKSKTCHDQSLQINLQVQMQDKVHKNMMIMKEDQRKSKEIIANLRQEIERLKALETPMLKTQPNEPSEYHINDSLQENENGNGNAKLYLNQLTNQSQFNNYQSPGLFGQFNSPGIIQSQSQMQSPGLMQMQSPQNNRLTSFNTHKDFDSTPQYKVASSRLQTKPQSSNSLTSAYTCAESKKKVMGNFKKMTSMAVGMYSNMLDYQSLANGSKMAAELGSAKIDLTQAVARKSRPTAADFQDNN